MLGEFDDGQIPSHLRFNLHTVSINEDRCPFFCDCLFVKYVFALAS